MVEQSLLNATELHSTFNEITCQLPRLYEYQPWLVAVSSPAWPWLFGVPNWSWPLK